MKDIQKNISKFTLQKIIWCVIGVCIVGIIGGFFFFRNNLSDENFRKLSGKMYETPYFATSKSNLLKSAYLEDPVGYVYQFIVRNKSVFSDDFETYLKNRLTFVQEKGKLVQGFEKNLRIETFSEGEIELLYNKEAILAGKIPMLWFVPYHFAVSNAVISVFEPLFTEKITPVFVNINSAQKTAKDFRSLSDQLSQIIFHFLKLYNIRSVDVLVSSMGTQWGLDFANKNIQSIRNIYLHEALVKKTDTDFVGFLNQYPKKLTKKEWDIQDILPEIDGTVPTDFFVGGYFYHLQKYHPKDASGTREVDFYKVRMYATSVNMALFNETWDRYVTGVVDAFQHKQELQQKIVCAITFESDAIAKLSDVSDFILPKTEIFSLPGGHNETWIRPTELVNTIHKCSQKSIPLQ